MAIEIVKNIRAGQNKRTPPAPIKENGEEYSFVYYPHNYSYALYADSYAEVINAFIKGYLEANENERITLRENYLNEFLMNLRIKIISNISIAEHDELEPWELNELNYHNDLKHISGGWAVNGNDGWKSEIPLVLLAKDYQPFTEKKRIFSEIDISEDSPKNIIWLKNNNEREFIMTLIKNKDIIVGRV